MANTKVDRQNLIWALIAENKVRNHEELQNLLASQGLAVTQATLSRDLNEMRIVKVKDNQCGYCYRLPDTSEQMDTISSTTLTGDGVKSIEFGSILSVVKTQPGYASAVASVIDRNIDKEIMGTLAGDDTVLVIPRPGYSRAQVVRAIAAFIPGIEAKVL